jgi:16S rRNA (uracil1498-N3)-methyltransferase
VESARKSAVVFRVSEEIAVAEPVVQIALCPALIKFDRFELLLEKATELGVAAIHPFSAARSEQGLLKAVPKRIERWRRIALEASQQSRRGRLPEIHDAVDSIQYLRVTAETRLFLDEDELVVPLLKRLAGQTLGSVALLTGPEGGWTEPERSAALEAGCLACGLGATTLRAETAAIAALAIVQAAAFAAS